MKPNLFFCDSRDEYLLLKQIDSVSDMLIKDPREIYFIQENRRFLFSFKKTEMNGEDLAIYLSSFPDRVVFFITPSDDYSLRKIREKTPLLLERKNVCVVTLPVGHKELQKKIKATLGGSIW